MAKYALIVDDSRVARMALRKQLLAQSWAVEECESAEQAIAWLHAHDDKPNVIFMDVMMTGMDGLTATREITGNTLFSAIPIVICTGNESEVDQQNAIKAGAIEVMTKPPQADKVEMVLSRLSDTNTSSTQTEPQSQQAIDQFETAQMTDKVIEMVTQNLQAKWAEQAQQMAEKVAKESWQRYEEQHFAQITQQIRKIVAQQLAEQKQQELTDVEHKVRNVMDEVLSDIDVMEQVKHDIGMQTGPWLEQQQRQLQVELGMQIGPQVIAAVDDYLKTSLTTMVTPVVTAKFDKLWEEHQTTVKTDIELDPMQNKITVLSQRIVRLQQGLAVMAVGLMLVVGLYLSA